MKQLGKEMSGANISLPGSMPADPLGLEKFTWPDYPFDPYTSLVLEKEWSDFKDRCRQEEAGLITIAEALQQEASEEVNALADAAIRYASTRSGAVPQVLPFYFAAASIKLRYYTEDKDGGAAYRLQKQAKETADIYLQVAGLKTKMDAEHLAIKEKYDPLIGEGRPNPLDAYCNEYNGATEKYLRAANELLIQNNTQVLNETRKRFNYEIYYSQYTLWPKQFEVAKLQAKANWLGLIATQKVEFVNPGPFCKPVKEAENWKGTLAEFDDVACQYHSHTDLIVWEFTADCSRLTGKLKLGNLAYTRKVDMEQEKLLRASLEISAGVSKGVSKGPVSAEAKAEIKGMLEWNDKEITNWTVEATAGVSAGTNIGAADKALGGKMPEGQTNYIEKAVGKGDQSIEIAGATARVGMNTGPSLECKGLLRGISIK